MHSVKIFNVLCLIMCVKSADFLTIDTYPASETYTEKGHFAINESDYLHIKVINLTNFHQKIHNCSSGGGYCEIHNDIRQDIYNVNVSKCDVSYNENQSQYLHVSVKDKIRKEYSGEWKCTYLVEYIANPNEQYHQTELKSNFFLEVIYTKASSNWDMNWIVYLCIGIGVIVLLIISVQTYCIIHFKRKAKAIRREAQWSNRKKENADDAIKTVRYCKMPGLKKKEVLIPESRESGIYEVLENVRVAPEPPPVNSLPKKKEVQKSSPVPSPVDSPAETPKWGTMTWNSWRNKKNKKTEDLESESLTSTLDKRTTLDRIKERPPQPLPTEDDIYEAMDNTPLPVRKEIKNKGAKEKATPKEDIRAFPQPKPKAGVSALPIGNVAPALNSQLQQAVEKRNRLNPIQPSPKPLQITKPTKDTPRQNAFQPLQMKSVPKANVWPKEAPNKLRPNESPLPKKKVWPKEPVIPPQKEWPKEQTIPKQWPKEATLPKQWPKEATVPKQWPKEPVVPKQKEWLTEPQESQWGEESQRPIGSLRPKVTPYNPGLPPPNAPPAKIRNPSGDATHPKPRPPPPVKPKQLHPLPPVPCEPVPIHDTQDNDRDSDDSEEWEYEALPQYNMSQNIYSNS